MKKLILKSTIILLAFTGYQWQRDSDIAFYNLSYEADAFKDIR